MTGRVSLAGALLTLLALPACGAGDGAARVEPKDIPAADPGRNELPVHVPDNGPEARDTAPEMADDGATDVPDSGGFVPCQTGAECGSGFCVDAPDGSTVCATLCSADQPCPEGWSCRPVTNTYGDVVFICLPLAERLCRPCDAHDDCRPSGTVTGDMCLDFGEEEGSFCGRDCSKDQNCPAGYTCEELVVGDTKVQQCRPDNWECECAEDFVAAGDKTPCARTNALGTCRGVRRCTAEGLSPCDAPDAVPESCNGADDDCDGITDEDFLVNGVYLDDAHCGDCQTSCAMALAHGKAACQLVAGKARCVAVACDDGFELAGTACIPADQCAPCESSADCGGGLECVQVGAGRFCVLGCGPSGECMAGLECAELPGGGAFCLMPTGGCAAPGSPCGKDADCEDLDPCTDGTCGRAGTCTFTAVDCDDGEECTEDMCDPVAGCVHPPVLGAKDCDDGNACTVGDSCVLGVCVASGLLDCEDHNPCTADACAGATCTHEPVAYEEPCYDGPPGTEAIPPCRPGMRKCGGTVLLPCAGQVTPLPETCGDGVDDDCSGTPDEGCELAGVDSLFVAARLAGAFAELTLGGGPGGLDVEVGAPYRVTLGLYAGE